MTISGRFSKGNYIPITLEIRLIDQPDLVSEPKQIQVEKCFGAISLMPALGAGKPSKVTTAPAVANAVFDATGVRLRQIPFTPERVRVALVESG